MMKRSDPVEMSSFRLKIAEGWFAYALPLEGFPLQGQRRTAYREFLPILLRLLQREAPLQRSVFLQLDELYQEGAVRELTQHGRRWAPEMGIGIYPEQPPPALWTWETLTDRDYDSPVPALKHTVAYLETDEEGNTHATSVMAGSGGVIELLHTDAAATIQARWREHFLPRITEEAYKAYPLYVPLFCIGSLVVATDEELRVNMQGVEIYLRESPEDRALLLVSRRELDALLRDEKIEQVLTPLLR